MSKYVKQVSDNKIIAIGNVSDKFILSHYSDCVPSFASAYRLQRIKGEALNKKTDWREAAKQAAKKLAGNSYKQWSISEGFETREINGETVETTRKFKHLYFYGDGSDIPGMRDITDCEDIIDLRHTGYFTDTFCDATVKGIVGVFRWGRDAWIVPGVKWSDQDSDYFELMSAEIIPANEAFDENGRLTLDKWNDDYRSVAYTADSIAENAGKDAREYDEKFQAEQLIERLNESIVETRVEIKKLVSEIKQAEKPFGQTICLVLKGKLIQLREHVSACRQAIGVIEDSPYEYEKFYSLV